MLEYSNRERLILLNLRIKVDQIYLYAVYFIGRMNSQKSCQDNILLKQSVCKSNWNISLFKYLFFIFYFLEVTRDRIDSLTAHAFRRRFFIQIIMTSITFWKIWYSILLIHWYLLCVLSLRFFCRSDWS